MRDSLPLNAGLRRMPPRRILVSPAYFWASACWIFFGARVAAETREPAYVSALEGGSFAFGRLPLYSRFSLNYEIKVPAPTHHDA